MNRQELLDKVSTINVCQSGDKRSPHKPLLLLVSLARIQQNKGRWMSFDSIEMPLVKLLAEFGPISAKSTPQLPYWHLQSEGIWEILNPDGVLTKSGSVSRKFLRVNQIKAGFSEEVFQLLVSEEGLVEQVALLLLENHFPASIQQTILDEVGLDLDADLKPQYIQQKKRKRDPGFRRRILEAYDYRCAICEFSVRMENTPIALEAAHIKWFQAGGPDVEHNGLSLCSLHHKLLDHGALAITPEHRIIVSEKANGHAGFKEWVLRFDNQPIRLPRKMVYAPKVEFVEWHIREVFKGS